MADIRFGFDHCRVCGKPITVRRPGLLDEWLQAQRKPPMKEAQWRQAGFLAAPTKYQMRIAPADGCCADCGLAISHRTSHYHWRGIGSIAAAVMFVTLVWFIVSYMRQ